MAVKKILEFGDETLRKVSHPVEKFNLRLNLLLRDMADTMYKAEGVGLAAPQVGILRRVVVIDIQDDHGLIELINPEIISAEGEQAGAGQSRGVAELGGAEEEHQGCRRERGHQGRGDRPRREGN